MKIDRLIGIITILLQQDIITAPELARRFEVSRRTINRDIEDICRAGIPLATTQGYGGGITIAPGYKIDKALLTQDELQAVFTGLKGMDSISPGCYYAALQDKLSSRKKRVAAEDVIIIDLASHYQGSLTAKIDTIKKAILGSQLIAFQYYYEKGDGTRKIEPYRILFKWSSWYVFGFCMDRKDYRLFKLNRLWDLQVLEERFVPREVPPEELHFDSCFSSEEIHLKAEFDETEKYRLIEEYGPHCYTQSSNGMLLFENNFASYNNMRQWVFSFGDRIRILEPEQLKADRLEQAENILREKDT